MNFFGKKQGSPSGDEVIADGTNDLRFDDAKSDYLYLDLLPEEMPDEQWAKIKVMMNFFKTNHHSPAVITGDLELDATARFLNYRDKKQRFLAPTSYHNFYDELHHRGSGISPQANLASQLQAHLTAKTVPGSKNTRYMDAENQVVLKIERDRKKRVRQISYFKDGRLTREDQYDDHERLFVSDYYAQMPNLQRMTLTEPLFQTTSIQGLILNRSGVAVVNGLPLTQQYWLNNSAGEPIKLFTDMNEILVWWLVNNFVHTDRKLYVDVSSEIFPALVQLPEMQSHLIPIVHDGADAEALQTMSTSVFLISQQFSSVAKQLRQSRDVKVIESWYQFMS